MDIKELRGSDRNWLIGIINGPNMPNLGKRDQRTYGTIASLDELDRQCVDFGAQLGVTVETFSSNHEGAILDYIHAAADRVDAFMINPAGILAVSHGVRHALQETTRPSIELHFSNIEAHGMRSVFTRTAMGMFMGLRQYTYVAALLALTLSLDDPTFLGPNDDPGPSNRLNGMPYSIFQP